MVGEGIMKTQMKKFYLRLFNIFLAISFLFLILCFYFLHIYFAMTMLVLILVPIFLYFRKKNNSCNQYLKCFLSRTPSELDEIRNEIFFSSGAEGEGIKKAFKIATDKRM
jgi:Ni,Fe-hydrogenase I cytochrome b subunit